MQAKKIGFKDISVWLKILVVYTSFMLVVQVLSYLVLVLAALGD